ncbi:MAG: DUF3696 domain-containing protein, partial [Nitrospinae bacterium]|nr:DUF3696 domain-containing protein [Nitrospinota bacterium]
MIRHVNLKNFKAWRELDIEFGPRITGLFGTNSSGKSSLLQFLLMLKETKNNPDRNIVLDFGKPGGVINLGGFGDVVHRNDKSQKLEWKLSWDGLGEYWNTSNADTNEDNVFVDYKEVSIQAVVAMANPEESKSLKTQSICYTMIDENSGKETTFSIGPTLKKENLFRFFDVKEKTPSGDVSSGHGYIETGPIKTHLFPFQAILHTSSENQDLLRWLELDYEKLMDRIYYLGPLRGYPHRQYNWSGGSPSDVGARGELTINAILAASEKGKTYQMKKGSRKRSFQEVVALRLKEMGLIHSFSVFEVAKGSNIYQAKVSVDKKSPKVLLTDVGFGVSQVLPVIVLLNHVPEGSTVILEQPEIHLHPEVQSGLADAIVGIAETRELQVIVESHSEHLLRRLQRRVADETIPAELVKLYFISQENGEARLTDIGLNEYGEIENWPEHFFGDEMEEIAATRKAAIKRKMKA